MSRVRLTACIERWPVAGTFRIARGAVTEVAVVTCEARDGDLVGRGECRPYARYGETPAAVLATVLGTAGPVADGLGRAALQHLLPAGAARNAIDCALLDLEAKRRGLRAWQVTGTPAPVPVVTAFTVSVADPAAMAREAERRAAYPVLKLKLGGDGNDVQRVAAVRAVRPAATLLVDANESWRAADVPHLLEALAGLGVAVVEQPLPAGADDLLGRIERPVAVCADESFHGAAPEELAGRYDLVNVKLDKAGGVTAALALAERARAVSLGVVAGCMVGTSLALAPATLLTPAAEFVDLDGALLLARDRTPGLRCEGARLHPPEAALWG